MPPKKRRGGRVVEPETPKGATKLQIWQQRVARARRMREDWERDYLVTQGESVFIGKMDGERVRFNHFAATVKVSRPNLFFQTPKFYVRPKPGRTQPVAERTAATGEGVLEAIARQDDNLETAGLFAVLQAYFRFGVLKVVYDPRMEPNPKAGEPMALTNEAGEPVIDPDTGAPVLLRHPMTGETIVEPDEVMTDETYRWMWVDAANMLLPDEGPDPLKWTWIGEEVVVPLSVAKEDSRFPKDKRAKLVGNLTHKQARQRQMATSTLSDVDDPLFKYVECYDIRNKTYYIWAEGQDDNEFLVDESIPSWVDNDPYAILPLGVPIMGPEPLPFPVPVVKDWIPIQQEYELRRRQITGGAGRSARKVLYTEQAFPDEEEARKALQSPVDMEAVKVNKTDESAIRTLVDSDLNGAIYKDTAFLQQDWRTITGQTGARVADPDAGTATEAQFVERAASLRDADMQKSINRWLAVAGRKMLQCVKETLTLNLWIAMRDISDKEIAAYFEKVYQMPPEVLQMFPVLKSSIKQQFGDQKWQSVTREELIFEADVTVQPGSTRPKTLDAERRAFIEVLKILGAAPQLALSRKLLEKLLAMFEIDDESIVEELFMLANKMVQVQANQAGRNQGTGAQQNGGVSDTVSSVLAGATGGFR